ncbi:MAG: NAD(P)-dependent alcohol dehydrogenase [Myxococcota bacterium]
MKAWTYDRYGDRSVLRLTEQPTPTLGPGEVLVKVRRAALNPKDALFRKGKFRPFSGRRFPKFVGLDAAGVVHESRSPRFAAGQRVFGFLQEWTFARGTVADFARFKEGELAPTPLALDDDTAAALPLATLTSLQALREQGEVRPGQRVLINGASGGVGTTAIQLAKVLGAEVHTVSSDANTALCRELGADRAWSYPAHGWKQEPPFDVIFDVFGNLDFAASRAHLAPKGRFISTVPTLARGVKEGLARLLSVGAERLVVVQPRTNDLLELAALVEARRLRVLIDARFAFEDTLRAFERLESKRTRGKLLIDVSD